MKGGTFRKVGWVWTKTGWKRVPKRSQAVKKIPAPTKRRSLKIHRIAPAPKRTNPPRPEAPQLPLGRGGRFPHRTGGRDASPAPSAAGLERELRRSHQAEGRTAKKLLA